MKYSYTVFAGSDGDYTVQSHTFEDAKIHAVAFALKGGWKPAKWHQFWRYAETQFSQIKDVFDEAIKLNEGKNK